MSVLAAPNEWFVLHTKSNQEKSLVDDLRRSQIEFFFPLIEKVKYRGQQKSSIEAPLFPGYVFLWGTQDQAYRADRTKRLAKIIEVINQTQLNNELQSIRLALMNPGKVEPYPYLVQGTRVEVKAGPMRGMRGIVESKASTTRLILQVEMLGRAVSVEIDGSLLEPL